MLDLFHSTHFLYEKLVPAFPENALKQASINLDRELLQFFLF